MKSIFSLVLLASFLVSSTSFAANDCANFKKGYKKLIDSGKKIRPLTAPLPTRMSYDGTSTPAQGSVSQEAAAEVFGMFGPHGGFSGLPEFTIDKDCKKISAGSGENAKTFMIGSVKGNQLVVRDAKNENDEFQLKLGSVEVSDNPYEDAKDKKKVDLMTTTFFLRQTVDHDCGGGNTVQEKHAIELDMNTYYGPEEDTSMALSKKMDSSISQFTWVANLLDKPEGPNFCAKIASGSTGEKPSEPPTSNGSAPAQSSSGSAN